jgi:dTDP-4-amino-4,6-dideoxygalactose transaminase
MHYGAALEAIKNYLDDNSNRNMHLTGTGAIAQLEKKLREFYKVKYALCFSNATNALTTAAYSLDIIDTEVITTPLNYGASISGLLFLGNRLTFSDIDKETNTLCILPRTIHQRITGKTSAVLAVDFGGVPHNMFRLREICDTYGLKYIADAAQSFGAFINGQPASKLADVWVTSFTAGKTLFAGEGAAIMTNDCDLFEKIIWYSQHPYRQNKDISLTAYNEFGFINGRMNPLGAILANETFDNSLKWLKTRQERYLDLIRKLNDYGIIRAIDYGANNLLPAFFKLHLAWKERQSKKELIDLIRSMEYCGEISPVEPVFKNNHFLSQFPGQFKGNAESNCVNIEREFFELNITNETNTKQKFLGVRNPFSKKGFGRRRHHAARGPYFSPNVSRFLFQLLFP